MTPTALSIVASVRRLRSQFPSLSGDAIYLENAGGSQVPRQVPDAISKIMCESYVQIEAGYPASRRATDVYRRAHALANVMMNGEGVGQTVIQPSTSQGFRHLADSYGEILKPGDEIVIAENGHEANIGPWVRLEKSGMKVVWWKVDAGALDCTLDGLRTCLTDRTRVVTFPHVSNLIGSVADVREISRMAHEVGAITVVDGVAAAPHLAPDVKTWDCDWYSFSIYKVFGPHIAALFGKKERIAELTGQNHFFIPRDSFEHKFALGCPSYEAMAGFLGTGEYLKVVAEESLEADVSRSVVSKAFDVFHDCERAPLQRLLSFLNSRPGVQIVGQSEAMENRVGIVSFRHASESCKEIVAATDAAEIGIRHGHMYSYRLCQALGIEPSDGVVRVSLAHYNTVGEIERLIEVLEAVL